MINSFKTSNSNYSKSNIGGFNSLLTKGFEPESKEYYITGFFYLLWVRTPLFLDEQLGGTNLFKSLGRVASNAVTLPDVTLNTTDVQEGFGGTNKRSIPTTIDLSNDINIKYYEYSGTPVSKAHQIWISGIRDYASGVSSINNYQYRNYTGDLLYITTKPVFYSGNSQPTPDLIESAHFLTGVMPTQDKQSAFSSDITNADKVEQDIPYKISQMFMGPNVNQFAASKLSEVIKLNNMVDYSIQDSGPKRP
jgi:hypothetical protein